MTSKKPHRRLSRHIQSILEPARRLPVSGHYDVVVLGGGPAGIAAAVAAARHKAKVLLVEQTGCLGGMGSAGLVPVFAPLSVRSKEPLARGIALEIVQRLRELGFDRKDHSGFGWIPIDAEAFKRVCDELVTSARVQVNYFTFFSDVIRRGKQLQAVILENKAGRHAVTAGAFIDATGDADVAARSGVKFEQGDSAGRCQAASLCIVVANVDIPRYWKFVNGIGSAHGVSDWCRKKESQKLLRRFPQAEYRGIHGQRIAPRVLGFNFGHVYEVDGTKPADITRIMTVGRLMANSFVDYARKHMPGMKDAVLVATAALPGIRETRRINGRFRLTIEHCLKAEHFTDDIARHDYGLDVHNSSRNARAFAKFARDVETKAPPPGESYGIPFSCLLPVGVDNLLVAGRALSADRGAQGCARQMPTCMAMGQACGTAAALAVKTGIAPADVDAQVLRKVLRGDGALL